jgi:NTE family protein
MAPTIPAELFTEDPEVERAIATLRESLGGRELSDVIDDQNHQYVDLVLQGGGILGLALVGATYAMERVGLRFRSVAGTSAGAINALLLAALGPPEAPKSVRMIDHLSTMDLPSFLDGPAAGVELSRRLAEGTGHAVRTGLRFLRMIPHLQEHRGLHPGDAFERWLTGILEAEEIGTTADLVRRMSIEPEGLRVRPGRGDHADCPSPLIPGRLAVVAVDAATETRFVFPRMARLVFEDPDRVNPAAFVRASMAIPGFFRPLVLPRLPEITDQLREAWDAEAGFEVDDSFREHVFIDGGVVSNFPIAEFHDRTRVPVLPTLGIMLGHDRRGRDLGTLSEFAWATFNSARRALDLDFLHRNPDYRRLICSIDTSGFSWLDFDLDADGKVELFRRGVHAAARLLSTFDWEKYKGIRRSLIESHRLDDRRPAGDPPDDPGPRSPRRRRNRPKRTPKPPTADSGSSPEDEAIA